jgi:hypothetical protein
MEIKVAETLNDVPLNRLAQWYQYAQGLGDIESLTQKIEFRVAVVSIFSGISQSELNAVSYRDVNKVFVHCIAMLAGYNQEEPSGVIEIDGQRYVYDKEIHNISTAQVIDIKLIEDPFTEPYNIMSTLYIEEGMSYNQEDKNGKILNPSKDRIDKFKDAPIGEEFLNMLGFFLSDYIILKAATLGKTVKKTKKILKRTAKEIKTANGSTGQQT